MTSNINVTLDLRGTHFVELTFCAQLNADQSFNMKDEENVKLFKELESLDLGMDVAMTHGPSGGNPLVFLHGTKENILKYLTEYYYSDPNFSSELEEIKDYIFEYEVSEYSDMRKETIAQWTFTK